MVRDGMAGTAATVLAGTALATVLLVTGCVSVRELAGYPAESTPSVSLRGAEARWVLIKNPRFGDVPSEPEYIWTEEDKIPWTFARMIRGKHALLAPPEIVAKYGSPPGGGKISPLQGMPAVTNAPTGQAPTKREATAEPGPRDATGATVAPKAVSAPPRGYVVFVDTSRIVIDLTARDGIRPGSVVSLRRDKIPVIHPVTGELLGELDEEVATAKVTEVRDRFSVAEVQSISPGTQIKVKDRVVPR